MYCKKNTKKCEDIEIFAYLYAYGKSPPCCRSHFYDLLIGVDKLFSECNIKYWLVGGSLLGAIRDNDIVKIDSDADIGMFVKDRDKLLGFIDKLCDLGFDFKYFRKHHFVLFVSKINRSHLDIFLYEEDSNDRYICKRFINNEYFLNETSFRKQDIIKLNTARIRDYYFSVPINPIPHLEKTYGKDWNVPLHFDNLNLEEPYYDKNSQHIPMHSDDKNIRKKWADILIKVRRD